MIVSVVSETNRACADDWPQWRGPRRDAVSKETGLLQAWPPGGPQVVWTATGLGGGYSSLVVGHGQLYTLGRHDPDIVVIALDAATGKSLWTRKIGESSRDPNATPTLDGDRLYAIDPAGELFCLKAATGEVLWTKSFVKDFSSRMMSGRGCGESPLIDGDHLICTPGNAEAALVALHKLTGEVIWKAKVPDLGPAGKEGAGFSSVVVTEAAGVRQYVQLIGRGLVGIAASDGRFLWGYNPIANDFANIPTPIVHREFVFAANGYTAGSVLLKLVPDLGSNGERPGVKTEVVYALSGSQFQNHHGGILRVGDFIYAGHGNNNGLPTCLELETGRIVWKRRGPGVGSAAIVYADGQLIFRYQNGVVALIEASEKGYQLNGTFEIPGAGGDSWSHPVVANGLLYLREQDVLRAYELRKDAKSIPPAVPAKPSMSWSVTARTLETIGVTVESSAMAEVPAKAALTKGRRTYRYGLTDEDHQQKEAVLIVTLTDANLSEPGAIRDDVFRLLKELPEALILNLEGTRISDAGLQQLSDLKLVGLNLELCPQVTDEGLRHLRPLKRLRTLILAETGVTNAGLKHLAENPSILSLELELCDGITDDACEILGSMTQLRSLGLKKSGFEKRGISDAGLPKLNRLSQLEVLNLYGNKVTDAGLTHLQPLSQLQELNLSLLNITDAGLESLKPLAALERLDLLYSEGFAGPRLTNGMVVFLEPLVNLTRLNLTGSKLTDAGLDQLKSLKNLKTLQLARTNVTSEGIQSFRSAIESCEIIK